MTFPTYQQYKDSGVEWLGEVPEHWNVRPFLSVARERNEQNWGLIENNLLSLSYGRIIRKDIDSNDGLLPDSFETYQIVRPGDIVFRLTDLQNDKRSLRTAVVAETGIITSAYVAAAPLSIASRFLHYLLRAYDTMKVFYSMGGGLRQSMKFGDIKRLPILIPDEHTQSAIVAFLDHETAKIDALVEEQRRLIELLKEKRQAVISHAVTRGLNPNAPMKDSGIEWLGEVPEHWEIKRLKFVAQVRGGIAKGRNIGERDLIEVPYLRVANVQDGYLDLAEIAQINISTEELDRYSLQAGDVLMNEGGDFDKLGRGHVWQAEITPCVHQNHVFAVRPTGIESNWLNLLTSSAYGRFYLMSRSKQSTNLASISSTNVGEFPLPCPPALEQMTIVEYVHSSNVQLDKLAAQANAAISLLQERRTALISAAVTGKIDVRDFAAKETEAA